MGAQSERPKMQGTSVWNQLQKEIYRYQKYANDIVILEMSGLCDVWTVWNQLRKGIYRYQKYANDIVILEMSGFILANRQRRQNDFQSGGQIFEAQNGA